MTRGEAWLSHSATALVGGTGLVYGWMCYFAESDDPYAITNHAWQSDLQHLHILLAPLLVFSCALFWRDHVWKRVRAGFAIRRSTGLVLFGVFVPMIVSGYVVQTASSEWSRTAAVWTHGVSSLLWIVAYVVHQISRRRARG